MVTNGISSPHYTPLEALLFFQALRAQDLTAIDFDKISEELLSVPLVNNDAAFDRERLSASALQILYLKLVKDEAREELDARLQNGSVSPGPRKRKAASPPLPTIDAAAKHAHLLPRLLYKLYSRYRDAEVKAIQEEEQRIDELDREIKQIETDASENKVHQQNGVEIQPQPIQISVDDIAQAPTNGDDGTLSDDAQAVEKPDTQLQPASVDIDTARKHTPEADTSTQPAVKAKSPARQPPSRDTESQPPALVNTNAAGVHSRPLTQSPLLRPGPTPSPYQPTPSMQQATPYLPHFPTTVIPQGTVQSPPTQHGSQSQSPTSPPKAFPTPTAIKMQSPPVVQNGFQQPRPQLQLQPSPYGSPTQRPVSGPGHPAGRGFPTPQHQQYQGFPSPYQQYPQQPYMQQPLSHQQQYHIRPSQQGGFQLPPFQVSAQDPSKVHHQYANQNPPAGRHSTPQTQPRTGPQSPYAQITPVPYTPIASHRLSLGTDRLTESVVASLRRRRSTATWKASPYPPPDAPKSPTRPVAEPMSPVRAHAELSRPVGPDKQPLEDAGASKQTSSDGRKSTRKTRGSSVASSTKTGSVRGRTRSQSVLSQPDAVPTSMPSTVGRRRVKHEPTTPAEAPTEAETPQPRTVRTRRGTLQAPSAPSTAKRSPRSTPRPDLHVPPRNDMVYATRNFSRLSAVILNEISAHRHAGPFQKPVSDRDVEGYRDIIKRPQDLKSIKAAITAGSRAVAAALAANTANDDSDTAGSSLLTLSKTEDLIPPRGIVNSAQLEREVMRMFANAVLFNPGDDGIVRDAREMADDIAGKIQDWRGVEREGVERERERDEDDGAAAPGSSKRRKL